MPRAVLFSESHRASYRAQNFYRLLPPSKLLVETETRWSSGGAQASLVPPGRYLSIRRSLAVYADRSALTVQAALLEVILQQFASVGDTVNPGVSNGIIFPIPTDL